MISWCIKDLWGTKVMYCYVLKLLFLTPQSYSPKSSCNVHLLRSPWVSRQQALRTYCPNIYTVSQGLEYTTLVKNIVDNMADDIEIFVQTELQRFTGHRTIPLAIIIVLGLMVPVIVYVTYLSTTSMFQYVIFKFIHLCVWITLFLIARNFSGSIEYENCGGLTEL